VSFQEARFVSHFGFTNTVFDTPYASFNGATVREGRLSFVRAEFHGELEMKRLRVLGGVVDFEGAAFAGGHVHFDDSAFLGGSVRFTNARFHGDLVTFNAVEFRGAEVDFAGAEFAGGQVTIDPAGYDTPPRFDPFPDGPPPGLVLPTTAR
jgi:hypothetical protein